MAPSADAVYTVLFANLMGSLVVVWSLYRLVRPSRAAGAADVAARTLFSLAMVAALASGASPLLLALLVPEAAWGVVQLIALRPTSTITTPGPAPVAAAAP